MDSCADRKELLFRYAAPVKGICLRFEGISCLVFLNYLNGPLIMSLPDPLELVKLPTSSCLGGIL